MKIERASHPESTFEDVNLAASRFSNVNLRGVRFENVGFTNTVFTNVCFGGVRIEDAFLEGATINGILVTELLRVYADRAGESRQPRVT